MAAPKQPKNAKPDDLTDAPISDDDSQEINPLEQAIVMPKDKHPSEWTKAEWEAYFASLPPGTHLMTDEEIAAENEREARGEYVDLDMTDEEFKAYFDSL